MSEALIKTLEQKIEQVREQMNQQNTQAETSRANAFVLNGAMQAYQETLNSLKAAAAPAEGEVIPATETPAA